MALLCLDEICKRINQSLPEIEEPLFALYYAPILAKEGKYTELDKLTKVNDYAAIFKYPMAIQMKARNISGREFKDFLKEVIIDSQAFESCSKISEAIHKFAVATIGNTRKYQQENSILENAIVSYCPIVPYSQTLKPQSLEGMTSANSNENPDFITEFPSLYCHALDSAQRITILRGLAISAPLAIIDTAGYYCSGVGIANIYQDLRWQDEKVQVAIMYWGLVSLLTMDEPPQVDVVENIWQGMGSLWSTKPEGKGAFESTFNALMQDTDINLDPAAVNVAQESYSGWIAQYDEDNPHRYNEKDAEPSVDIMKLISAFHARRGISTSAMATSYVESEWKDAIIVGVSAFSNDITLITFNNELIGIPFIDIADDHQIKVMCINRYGDIHEYTANSLPKPAVDSKADAQTDIDGGE